MSGLFSLQGKRALVTGGSRGIGLEIARGFVSAGVDVTISSRKADAVAAAAEELGCRGVTADLSTPKGCRGLAAEVDGPLHVLVNNAGVTWGAPLEEFPDAGWDKVLDTNVKGLFQLTVALLPRLREAASDEDPARVLNVGSVEGSRVPAIENSEEGRAAVAATVPLGRIGTAEDLVGTTTFLCSRAGAYLTGAVIPLDGGISGCA